MLWGCEETRTHSTSGRRLQDDTRKGILFSIGGETKFSADGTIETNYLEIGQILREMIKMERKKYEVNK